MPHFQDFIDPPIVHYSYKASIKSVSNANGLQGHTGEMYYAVDILVVALT